MKKYDLIIGIGCSFMEGGGLDNTEIHKLLNGLDEIASKEVREKFKYENNFIAYLSKLLNCNYINFGESMASNDLIFRKIYDYFRFSNHMDENVNILFVGQLSMFQRMHIYYDYAKRFTKLNRVEFTDPPFYGSSEFKPLYDFYKNYLSFIYNENDIVYNLERNMDLYTNYLENKNVDCIWLSYDGTTQQFVDSNNFIKFNGDNLGAFIEKNKLRLCDVNELNTGDLHISIKGHKIVAEKIYKKLL